MLKQTDKNTGVILKAYKVFDTITRGFNKIYRGIYKTIEVLQKTPTALFKI